MTTTIISLRDPTSDGKERTEIRVRNVCSSISPAYSVEVIVEQTAEERRAMKILHIYVQPDTARELGEALIAAAREAV